MTTHYRVAVLHTEGDPTLPTPDYMLTAFDSATVQNELPIGENSDGTAECESSPQISSEAAAQSNLGALPVIWDLQHTAATLQYPPRAYDMTIAGCGPSQRYTFWNRSCSDVLAAFPELRMRDDGGTTIDLSGPPGLFLGAGFGYQDYAFPFQYVNQADQETTTTERRCAILEAATTPKERLCSDGATCNSSDLCVTGANPAIRYLSLW